MIKQTSIVIYLMYPIYLLGENKEIILTSVEVSEWKGKIKKDKGEENLARS